MFDTTKSNVYFLNSFFLSTDFSFERVQMKPICGSRTPNERKKEVSNEKKRELSFIHSPFNRFFPKEQNEKKEKKKKKESRLFACGGRADKVFAIKNTTR